MHMKKLLPLISELLLMFVTADYSVLTVVLIFLQQLSTTD